MRFSSIVVLLLVVSIAQAARLNKKSRRTALKPNVPKSAIIAIQIIDPQDEKKGGKNSKRTIDSALGYGYQSNHFGEAKYQAPKYQVYKYSQHDIPPYQGSYHHTGGYNNGGSSTSGLSKQYLPGTTLFSSINQHGQLGVLSPHLPNTIPYQDDVPIPVIVLRIQPSQLASPGSHLYPNIPSNNQFAPLINSIDIKSLLSSYVPSIQGGHNGHVSSSSYQYVQQPHVTDYQQNHISAASYHQPEPQYVSPQHYQPETQYAPAQQSVPQHYQQEPQYVTSHQSVQSYESRPQYVEPQKYQAYEQSQYPQQYQEVPRQEAALDVVKSKEYILPTRIYHENYQQTTAMPKDKGLLTHENYPAETHTRVIFKNEDGQIRTTSKQHEDPNPQSNEATVSSVNYNQYDDYNEQSIDQNQYIYQNVQPAEEEHSQKVYYVPMPRKRKV